jgi:hypothetical protein
MVWNVGLSLGLWNSGFRDSRRWTSCGAAAFLALLVGLLLLSCGSTHQYYANEYETELSSGLVDMDMWPTDVQSGEDIGTAVIHKDGTLWCLNLTYWPTCRKPTEVELFVDSVRIIIPSSGVSYPLDRSRWRRYQSDNSTTVKISPISLSRNSYPDIIIELVLRVESRADGSLLDRHRYRLKCTH